MQPSVRIGELAIWKVAEAVSSFIELDWFAFSPFPLG
jgi:hypothetical protein